MALVLDRIRFLYGGHLALDDVSLHVRAGDCYGFLGHNGAGKTTTLRIALGLLRPSAGSVSVCGVDALRDPVRARACAGGLIETPGFHGHLGGARNLLLLARLQGMGARAAEAEVRRVLDEVGLAHAAQKPVAAYSQGMRQRLGIAQALLGRPRLVLLDEPTNGLDPEGIEEMRRVLARVTREEGTTVLLSSHQLHEISGLCNRVAILREGRVLLEDETAHLTGGGGLVLRAGDPARAAEIVAACGAVAAPHDEGALLVTPGDVPEDALLRALVEGGARPLALAPRRVTLEDVYLRYARGTAAGPAPVAREDVQPRSDASALPAPPRSLLRVCGYELRRVASSWTTPVLYALPALVGVLAVVLRHAETAGYAAEIAGGTLQSTTDVTAFEGVGTALRAGVPVLALVAGGFASQSLAGELGRGTLRNVLLRPARRVHVALGKCAAQLGVALAAYVLLAGAALAASAAAFDFGDVTELLFNDQRMTLVPAAELWEPLRVALVAPLPALAACVALGFAAGALARGAAAALAAAFAALLVPDALRAVLRGFHAEWTVPHAHLPTALADTSYVHFFLDRARGVSNAAFDGARAAWAVPSVWLAACVVVAVLVLFRRSVR